MTFPTTGTLDDFTRADGALGANWTVPLYAGNNGLVIVSDQATTDDPSNGGDGYWNTAYSAYCEVYAECLTFTDGSPYLFACLSNEGTDSLNGYQVWVENGSIPGGATLYIVLLDGDTDTTLTTVSSLTFLAGDSLGMSVAEDGTITAYRETSGTWTTVGTATDTTFTGGKIGVGWYGVGSDPLAVFGSFGGGGSAYSGGGGGAPAVTTGVSGGLLLCQATDLSGNPISGIGHPLPLRTDGGAPPTVSILLSDSRTGTLAVSMYEDIAAALQVASTAVKVWYFNPATGTRTLVLWGHVLSKTDDFDAGTTTVQLHDATIRLKKRYLGYNHYSIYLTYNEAIPSGDDNAFINDVTGGDFEDTSSAYGVPLDGTGLRLMMLDTSHGASDWPGGGFDGIPPMGIRYGVDNANRQPVYGAGEAGDGVPFNGIQDITGTLTEGNDTITDVSFSGAVATNAAGATITPTISTVPEYGALVVTSGDGLGIPQFSIVSSASGTSIVMSEEATLSGSVTFSIEAAIYCQLARGDCVYDDWTDMVQSQGAFECDFVPVDKDSLGPSGDTWEAGQMCELYTANRVGTDRSVAGNAPNGPGSNVPVQFTHGIGGFHVVHAPDADYLITYCVEAGPGGPEGVADVLNKTTQIASGAVENYGIWEAWEQAVSAGTGDNEITNAVLANRSNAVLTAYQNPPQFITATVDTDVIGHAVFCKDYFIGDTVTVFARKGSVTVGPLSVRITEVDLTATDENGNTQVALTLVPYLTADPGLGEGQL